ncbi:MAG TPA: metalloregulator ArsR/SmtB family transcription factor [Thermoleophilia bacterium]|nr:metalloregulator ArsR/SmtB family transcription factor [Thermoleophilia bacterium]
MRWGRVRELASMFKALGDETRLEMLALLAQRDELCVCRFEEALGITQSKASRHLRYLLNAGLVTDRRDAVWVHYRIAPDLGEEQAALIDALPRILGEARMAATLARLLPGDVARESPSDAACEAGSGVACEAGGRVGEEVTACAPAVTRASK